MKALARQNGYVKRSSGKRGHGRIFDEGASGNKFIEEFH